MIRSERLWGLYERARRISGARTDDRDELEALRRELFDAWRDTIHAETREEAKEETRCG